MMHEKAKLRLETMLRDALPTQVDILLDEYATYLLYATNWDADQWGLPTPEIEDALLEHAKLNGPMWPKEVI